MKKIITLTIILCTILASVYAIEISNKEFLALNESILIQGTRPIISGNYDRDIEGNYYIEYLYYTAAHYNQTHISIDQASQDMTVWYAQLEWCYNIYTPQACNNFWLTGTQPYNLATLGYEGRPFWLEPLTYLRNQLWIETYQEMIDFRNTLNQTQYDFFPEEEGGGFT